MAQSIGAGEAAKNTSGWGKDLRATLGDVLDWTNLSHTPAVPEHRPQDVRYTFPDRGLNNHGLDDDTLTEDYYPNQTDGEARLDDEFPETQDNWRELVAATPIPVYDVPNPAVTVIKQAQIQQLYGTNEVYDTAAGTTPLMRKVADTDDTRTSLTFRVGPSMIGSDAKYVFAVSQRPNMVGAIVLSGAAGMNSYTTEDTKSEWWVSLVVLSAYDAAAVNSYVLHMLTETATTTDHDVNGI
jgi:hypothetical protein